MFSIRLGCIIELSLNQYLKRFRPKNQINIDFLNSKNFIDKTQQAKRTFDCNNEEKQYVK